MRPKHSKAREDFLDEILESFLKKIESLQRSFFAEIYDYLDTNLDVIDGEIRSTAKNINSINRLGLVSKDFEKGKGFNFIKWLARKYIDISLLSRKYFGSQSNDFDIKKVSARVEKKLLGQIGITVVDKKISIANGSFLRDVTNFDEAVRRVKQIANRQAADGKSLLDLKKAIRTYANSTDKDLPVKKLNRIASDSFRIFDRGLSADYGKQLGLRAAIWQGGVRDTSRPWCVEHNNKVYTYDELKAMELEQWEGKWPEAGFNIFIHVGGINCYHQLDHISDQLAIRLRPELKDEWGL